jgi:hypothetical protein
VLLLALDHASTQSSAPTSTTRRTASHDSSHHITVLSTQQAEVMKTRYFATNYSQHRQYSFATNYSQHRQYSSLKRRRCTDPTTGSLGHCAQLWLTLAGLQWGTFFKWLLQFWKTCLSMTQGVWHNRNLQSSRPSFNLTWNTNEVCKHNTLVLYNVLHVPAHHDHHWAPSLQKFKNVSTFSTRNSFRSWDVTSLWLFIELINVSCLWPNVNCAFCLMNTNVNRFCT